MLHRHRAFRLLLVYCSTKLSTNTHKLILTALVESSSIKQVCKMLLTFLMPKPTIKEIMMENLLEFTSVIRTETCLKNFMKHPAINTFFFHVL